MKTTDLDAKCPECGYVIEKSSDMTGEKVPKVGDVSICIECAGVGEFAEKDGKLTVVKASEETLEAMATDPEAIRMRMAIMTMNRQRN